MAFYTPNWVRSLVKEEHKVVQSIIDKGDDLRKYFDSKLPFTLYLTMDLIKERILDTPEVKEWMQELADITFTDIAIIYTTIENAYKGSINTLLDAKYKDITPEELQEKLLKLSSAYTSKESIRSILDTEFKSTMRVKTPSLAKRNNSVLLIFPSFRTLEFGPIFRKNFDLSLFSDNQLDNPNNTGSPRELALAFITKNFARLQNIGHVEVDVISSSTREIKRGQNSPRLLQALLALPKGANAQRMAVRFSKETGQAETRIIVRKKFSTTKMVMEMLVESGMSVGIPETQKINLLKAAKERAFEIGKSLSAKIAKDKSFLVNLETSKSISQYLSEEIKNSLLGKKAGTYSSNTTILVNSSISINIPKLDLSKYPISTSRNTFSAGQTTSFKSSSPINLENLLRSRLVPQIEKNMGKGTSTTVLNYRTGRLANSVKIDHLSISRQGMITVFYDYMRYPYATFSEGGAQQLPRSRDPKALISKSIREIGVAAMYTKMRAVLV